MLDVKAVCIIKKYIGLEEKNVGGVLVNEKFSRETS